MRPLAGALTLTQHAALSGDKTIAQLSDQHGVHVSQITAWKEQLQASAAHVFGPSMSGTLA